MAESFQKCGVRSRDSLPRILGGANWPPESESTVVAAKARIGERVDEKRVYEKCSVGDGDKLFEDFENCSIEKLEADRNDRSECQSD